MGQYLYGLLGFIPLTPFASLLVSLSLQYYNIMSQTNDTLCQKDQLKPSAIEHLSDVAKDDFFVAAVARPSPLLNPPTEIISRIIELGDELGESSFPTLISHVCSRLRSIALGNAAFWTSIRFVGGRKSYDDIRSRLERSKNAPLRLTITRLLTPEDADMMLGLLYPHVGRWLSFISDDCDKVATDVVVQTLTHDAPILETLSLGACSMTRVNPFAGRTPTLRSLIVKDVSLLWESPLFENLTILDVSSSVAVSPTFALAKWDNLQKLTVRVIPRQRLVLDITASPITLPSLECLELCGLSEEDVVIFLSISSLPNLCRLLLTHIKDSRTRANGADILPLPKLRHIRLHTTEVCQANLLSILRQAPNLDRMSFEDSSPIPRFIDELTRSEDPSDWVCPKLSMFQVAAFGRDNARRAYDDTDITAALKEMMVKRQSVQTMVSRMCVFAEDRNLKTRGAAPWDEERTYKSEKLVSIEPEGKDAAVDADADATSSSSSLVRAAGNHFREDAFLMEI